MKLSNILVSVVTDSHLLCVATLSHSLVLNCDFGCREYAVQSPEDFHRRIDHFKIYREVLKIYIHF
jgi:hypothetical protein